MSHLTRLKTKITDRPLLKAVLEELGYTVWEAQEVPFLQGGFIRKEFCDLVISAVPPSAMPSRHSQSVARDTRTRIPVGELICFQKNDSHYEVIADWSEAGISQAKFMNTVMHHYALRMARQKIESQGYKVKLQIEHPDQSLTVLLTRDQTLRDATTPQEQQIECQIKDGEVSIITRGFQREACFHATRELEQALGNDILQQDWTMEGFSGAEVLAPVREREYAYVEQKQDRKPDVKQRLDYVYAEPKDGTPRQEYVYGERRVDPK